MAKSPKKTSLSKTNKYLQISYNGSKVFKNSNGQDVSEFDAGSSDEIRQQTKIFHGLKPNMHYNFEVTARFHDGSTGPATSASAKTKAARM